MILHNVQKEPASKTYPSFASERAKEARFGLDTVTPTGTGYRARGNALTRTAAPSTGMPS